VPTELTATGQPILDGAADLLYAQEYKREYARAVMRMLIAAARADGYAGPVPTPPTLPTWPPTQRGWHHRLGCQSHGRFASG
jgi:hypothetical protein